MLSLMSKKRDPTTSMKLKAVRREQGKIFERDDSDEDASVEDDEIIDSSSICEVHSQRFHGKSQHSLLYAHTNGQIQACETKET